MLRSIKLPFKTQAYLESTVQTRTMADEWVANGAPRWVPLIDEALFVLASLIFILGSLCFYPDVPFAQYVEGCELYIVGSSSIPAEN